MVSEFWDPNPPTQEDIDASYNGYFWMRYFIGDGDDGLWIIEPVQINYLTSDSDGRTYKLGAEPVFTHPSNEELCHLNDPEDVKNIFWQHMVPPNDVEGCC